MQRGATEAAELIFVFLLIAVVGFAALARKIRLPYPIVLVLAGLAVGFVPGTPRIALDPDVIFYVVLPPLVYAAAWQTSWREFSYNLVSVISLAIGLVGLTVAGVALGAPFILPGFDWRTGFVLGAVVSTTDAIAATTIVRRMGLPRRVADVLEGESLVNDATGLLALELGVSLILFGSRPDPTHVLLRFGQLLAGGLAVGMLVAWVVQWVEQRIDDAPIEVAISLLVPYIAYLLAEGVRASGVLAVVAAGLFLSRKSSQFFSPAVRIQAYSVWNAHTFVLNGLVFLVIGLQLRSVLAGVRGAGAVLAAGVAFSALVIALRLALVFPGARLSYFIRSRILHQRESVPPARQLVVVGWAGLRGVIALAAAMSLPRTLPDGRPFPQRDLIVFLTYCVILATLVFQGLTLAPLIRALGLAGPSGPAFEEQEARLIALQAALSHLEKTRPPDRPDLAPIYDDLALHYRRRLAGLTGKPTGDEGQSVDPEHHERFRALSRELARTERNAALALRDQGRIDDDVLRQIEHELDLTEARLQDERKE